MKFTLVTKPVSILASDISRRNNDTRIIGLYLLLGEQSARKLLGLFRMLAPKPKPKPKPIPIPMELIV